jgi:carboxylesterase type B
MQFSTANEDILFSGLFHRAISQSGSALNAWAFNEPETNHNFSYGLAKLLGYNYTDLNELIERLREETPERIVNFTFILGAQVRMENHTFRTDVLDSDSM